MATGQDINAILNMAAGAYHTNAAVLQNIAQDESSGNVNAINHTDINAQRGTPSAGLMQFIQPTFQAFSRQARAANPSAWKGVNATWMDPQAQALTASWAIANGKGGNWSTYTRALKQAHASGAPSLGLVNNGLRQTQLAAPRMLGAADAAAEANAPNPTADYFKQAGDTWFGNFLTGVQQQRAAAQAKQYGDASQAAQQFATQSGLLGQSAAAMQAAASSGDQSQVVATATQETGKVAAQAAAFLKQHGVPYTAGEWCKEFVDATFKAAGLQPPAAGVENVPGLLRWAEKTHAATKAGAAGEEVMFDWNGDGVPDHVGLVTGVSGGKIQEVGGNQGGGAGSVTRDTFAANDPRILGYVRGH